MPRFLFLLTLAPPALADEDGLPLPPSENLRQYRVWRARLPKAVQTKLAQHCRDHGGDYQQACNGIGPLAIPPPTDDLTSSLSPSVTTRLGSVFRGVVGLDDALVKP